MITLTGEAAGQKQEFTYGANLAETASDATNGFVVRLWALRQIGDIIDDIASRSRVCALGWSRRCLPARGCPNCPTTRVCNRSGEVAAFGRVLALLRSALLCFLCVHLQYDDEPSALSNPVFSLFPRRLGGEQLFFSLCIGCAG
jgi:hypothetical protein